MGLLQLWWNLDAEVYNTKKIQEMFYCHPHTHEKHPTCLQIHHMLLKFSGCCVYHSQFRMPCQMTSHKSRQSLSTLPRPAQCWWHRCFSSSALALHWFWQGNSETHPDNVPEDFRIWDDSNGILMDRFTFPAPWTLWTSFPQEWRRPVSEPERRKQMWEPTLQWFGISSLKLSVLGNYTLATPKR